MSTEFIPLLFFSEMSNLKKSKNPMGIFFPYCKMGKNSHGKN